MFSERTNWNLAPNRLTEAVARHRAGGKPLIDLIASNPTECRFRYDSEAILQALHNPAALSYHPDAKGLESARRAVVNYYRGHEIEVPLETIILAASTSEAYSFIFRTLCNPGDELLIPAPSYPLFDLLAEIQDVQLVSYPLLYDHGWQIDFHALEKAITSRTRGVIVVHPNNPTGHFTKPAELARLNAICSAPEMALIADEVFLDFALEARHPLSLAANRGALTFAVSGLSKISGLPQMKVAWLIVTGTEHLKTQALERLEVIADTYLSVNTPVQVAVPIFLDQRHAFQPQLLARVRHNLTELDRQLARPKAVSRLHVEGGWYAVLRVPSTRPDEDLAIALLESKSVYLHPGHFYNFPSDGYIVVSLITPQEKFAEGTARLLSMF
jgi:alanine-synthesizing transaminase